MSLTVIFDNNPFDPRLQTGWGFAAWLQYGNRTVLFDTGADGALLLSNMATLGLDPRTIEIVVLSHIHGDHTDGLAALLDVNSQVTIYVPQAFPTGFKDQARAAGATVVDVSEPLEILPGLWTTGQMGTQLVEQALVVKTVQGLVVVTGCAHPGVDRMVARAQEIGQDEVYLVLGGFHLGGATEQRIQSILAEFRRLGVQEVAPCHCTGDRAKELFRRVYGEHFYAIGVGWQTSDSVEPWQSEVVSWQPASQDIPAQVGVAAVAIAPTLGTVEPSDPRLIYLAAYELGGLYRSADGGVSWQEARRGLESLAPLTVAVDATNPDVAWVGTRLGGYRTTDGGQNWQPMTALPERPIYALALTAGGRTLYAGGEATGIWRSDDGGETWKPSKSATQQLSILGLAIAPDGTVFAGTAGQGVWASRDDGQSWQMAGDELAQAYVSVLEVAQDNQLYALASSRLYLSRDGGATWKVVGPSRFEALSFAAEPGPGRRLYLGSKGNGLAVSPDGGESWITAGNELHHAGITCLAADPVTPGRAYLGTLHNGLYQTTDGGESWTLISGQVGQPVVAALVQDPKDAQVFYAGTLDGVYRSSDGGGHWQLVSGGVGKVFVQGLAVSPTTKRLYAGTRTGIYISEDGGTTWRWATEQLGTVSVFNVVVDPHEEDRVYAGSWGHNVLHSTDGGQSWAPIHHGLETLSAHAFAASPTDPRVLYAGTVEAIYRSTDGGESWQASPLTSRPLTTFALVVDPTNSALVYAGTTEGVYRSDDGGQTWQAIGSKRLNVTVTALAPSPTDPRTLYAGTEHHGLFQSTDGGEHWQGSGLEGTSVYAVLVDRSGTIWLGTDKGIFKR